MPCYNITCHKIIFGGSLLDYVEEKQRQTNI